MILTDGNLLRYCIRRLMRLLLVLIPLISLSSFCAHADEYLQEASSRVARVTGLSWEDAVKRNDLFLVRIEGVQLPDPTLKTISLNFATSTCVRSIQKQQGGNENSSAPFSLGKAAFSTLSAALAHVEWAHLPDKNPFETGLDGTYIYVELHHGVIHWRGWRWQHESAYGFPASDQKKAAKLADPFAGNEKLAIKQPNERILSLFVMLCLIEAGRE